MINIELKNKIIQIAKQDQDLRKEIFRNGHKATEEELQKLKELDKNSTLVMKQIVKEFGLLTIQKVGKLGSLYAWLLIQHSKDLELQKKYLELLKKAKRNEVRPDHLAYLEDRINMNEGKPQKYGTQVVFVKTTGKAKPYTLEDEKNVDLFRKSVGLESLKEYLESFD